MVLTLSASFSTIASKKFRNLALIITAISVRCSPITPSLPSAKEEDHNLNWLSTFGHSTSKILFMEFRRIPS